MRAANRDGMGPFLEALRLDPRQAIQEERIVCLLCGAAFRQLTNTHLRRHGITSRGYKRRCGYNRRRPLMCRALLRLYRERAIQTELAAYIQHRPILSDPELRRRGGVRLMALEERLARWEARQRRPAYRTGAVSRAAPRTWRPLQLRTPTWARGGERGVASSARAS